MKQKRKNRCVPRLCLNGVRLMAAALFAGLSGIASGCGSTGEEGGYQYRITRGQRLPPIPGLELLWMSPCRWAT